MRRQSFDVRLFTTCSSRFFSSSFPQRSCGLLSARQRSISGNLDTLPRATSTRRFVVSSPSNSLTRRHDRAKHSPIRAIPIATSVASTVSASHGRAQWSQTIPMGTPQFSFWNTSLKYCSSSVRRHSVSLRQ